MADERRSRPICRSLYEDRARRRCVDADADSTRIAFDLVELLPSVLIHLRPSTGHVTAIYHADVTLVIRFLPHLSIQHATRSVRHPYRATQSDTVELSSFLQFESLSNRWCSFIIGCFIIETLYNDATWNRFWTEFDVVVERVRRRCSEYADR